MFKIHESDWLVNHLEFFVIGFVTMQINCKKELGSSWHPLTIEPLVFVVASFRERHTDPDCSPEPWQRLREAGQQFLHASPSVGREFSDLNWLPAPESG